MEPVMKISVVITVLNEAKAVAGLLEALAQQTRDADEIILVDGGSTDDTVAIAHEYKVMLPALTIQQSPGTNIAAGRNVGIRAARGDIIVTTDAGCFPKPQWLNAITAPFVLDPLIGLVSGVVKPLAKTEKEDSIGRCSLAYQTTVRDKAFLPTARSLAFRRALAIEMGGFPENLDFGEDTKFILDIAQNTRLSVAEEAIVYWRPRQNYWAVVKQYYHYAFGLVQARLSRRFHLRTIGLNLVGITGLLLSIGLKQLWPLMIVITFSIVYLWRKKRAGCFDGNSWRRFYLVPFALLAIHLGTIAGIIAGHCVRLWDLLVNENPTN
jgi:glycosyltransferase involved in cell wall biosynthesis